MLLYGEGRFLLEMKFSKKNKSFFTSQNFFKAVKLKPLPISLNYYIPSVTGKTSAVHWNCTIIDDHYIKAVKILYNIEIYNTPSHFNNDSIVQRLYSTVQCERAETSGYCWAFGSFSRSYGFYICNIRLQLYDL